MKIIYWKSLITGAEGNGKPVDDDIADAWVAYLNEKYPELYHWTSIYHEVAK